MKVTIKYVKTAQEARAALAEGFEPIECAFGREGSVVGPLQMDHHGELSNLPGVAIRAHTTNWEARKTDPRFVVTGSPDLDAVAAIAGLAGLLRLTPEEAELINAVDIDPIGVGSLVEKGEAGLKILAFNQAIGGTTEAQRGFEKGLEIFVETFSRPLTNLEKELVKRSEAERILLLTSSALLIWEHQEGEPVALAANPAWGFDVWYERAPCVVAYVEAKKSITIGVRSLEDAEMLFGSGGLKNTYPMLDEKIASGFGGRETVGGSPRGREMTLEEARKVKQVLLELTQT